MYKNIIFFLFIILLSACSTKETMIKHKVNGDCEYYSLKTAKCQNTKQLVKNLQAYKIIFVGDHHNENNMHKKVAELIDALSLDGTKVHLAHEWFYPSDEEILKKFSKGEIGEKEFLKKIEWKKRLRNNKYESFRPIYEAVKNSNGEIHGINMSKAYRKKISDQNLSVMSKKELAFNSSLDLQVQPHKELILPFLSHCHAPKKDESLKECTQRMYRVQVAWDSKMALESYKLSSKLKKNEKLIIFAGSMHIEKRLGIPLRYARLSNLPTLSIIPADKNTKSIDNDAGDYILFYKSSQNQ